MIKAADRVSDGGVETEMSEALFKFKIGTIL